MERTILHVDMDAYFASVEQAANPSLRGRPVAVCGEGRTIVTTASYEARKYGVKTGMTLPETRRRCPGIILVHGNLDKYVDTSFRIHGIFLEFTCLVEVFSIDECFLDITRLCEKGAMPHETALRIKKRIREETGLSCSVGIGSNKVTAKLASGMRKPDGIFEISPSAVKELFSNLPVEELQGVGVGRKISAKLRSLGINTAGQLGDASIAMLNAHFGIIGYHLKKIGTGENDSPVKAYREYAQAKSVGHSYTLPRDTCDLNVIKSYLRMLSERVGFRLRKAKLSGRTVCLVVRYSDFNTFGRSRSVRQDIKTGYDIYSSAWKLFGKILPLKKAVRLLGVSISGLAPDAGQGFILDNMEKQRKLTETLDAINRKYGDFTVKPSCMMIAEKFGLTRPCGMTEKLKTRNI